MKKKTDPKTRFEILKTKYMLCNKINSKNIYVNQLELSKDARDNLIY